MSRQAVNLIEIKAKISPRGPAWWEKWARLFHTWIFPVKLSSFWLLLIYWETKAKITYLKLLFQHLLATYILLQLKIHEGNVHRHVAWNGNMILTFCILRIVTRVSRTFQCVVYYYWITPWKWKTGYQRWTSRLLLGVAEMPWTLAAWLFSPSSPGSFYATFELFLFPTVLLNFLRAMTHLLDIEDLSIIWYSKHGYRNSDSCFCWHKP